MEFNMNIKNEYRKSLWTPNIISCVKTPYLLFLWFKKKKKKNQRKKKTKTKEEIIWWVTKKKNQKIIQREKKNILLTQFFCPFLSKFIANKTNEKEKQFPVNSIIFPLLSPQSKQTISEPFKNTKNKKEKRKKRVTWT